MACDSFTWYGTTYTSTPAVAPTHVFSNIYGCDSTVTLHLTVNHSNSGDTTAVACDSFTWYSGDTTAVACDSFTWYGTTYTSTPAVAPTHVFSNIYGCDSTVTLNLTVNHSNSGDTTAMACGSFDWYEHTGITASTETLTHVFSNIHGCDSTVTLHLTINNPVHESETVVACGSYTWNSTTYTVSGNYTYEHADIHGCTQVDTLHLTLGNRTEVEEYATSCDSYEWNGQVYTVSGDYTFDTVTLEGCDSIVTLHLTVNYSDASTIDTLVRGSFVWNNETFTESGTYVRTIETIHGCDSVVTIHLTVIPEDFVMPYLYNLMNVMLSVNHNEEGAEHLSYIYYRWYRDGELVLEGPDKDSYSEGGQKLNGCYYLEVAIDENLEYWVRSNTVCIGTTGIDDVEAIDFTVAPNPVMHGSMVKVSVDGADLQGAEVCVYDVQGRMIIKQQNNGIIEAPAASGTYLVRLTLSDGRTATDSEVNSLGELGYPRRF